MQKLVRVVLAGLATSTLLVSAAEAGRCRTGCDNGTFVTWYTTVELCCYSDYNPCPPGSSPTGAVSWEYGHCPAYFANEVTNSTGLEADLFNAGALRDSEEKVPSEQRTETANPDPAANR